MTRKKNDTAPEALETPVETPVEALTPENSDQEAPAPPTITRAAKPLALKMARVMSVVRHVPKRGRNDFHKYTYIQESDLVDRLRGALAAQGVAIFPSIREHVVTQTQDNRGKNQFLATVTLELTFVDGESGDQMTTTWVGQGLDPADKAFYKAYTGAFKHALLKTFLVTPDESSQQPMSGRGGRRQQGRR